MNLRPLEQINNLVATDKPAAKQEALRQAARQFEAVLLMQLTSALNKTSDDEDSLFGSDGGSGLAKQLFSEQLATTMAESGGVGLSDLIMQKFGAADASKKRDALLSKTLSAVREIKQSDSQPSVSANQNAANSINKNGKIEPVTNSFSGDPDEAQVISTFADEVKTEGIDDSLKNLVLDGKIQNSTRPRIVPDQPVKSVSNAIDSIVERKTVEYRMPVEGRISSSFGNRFHPIDKRAKFHGGIDLAVPKGTPVGAAADGVVTFAGWKNGYGNLVVVEHADGRETRYAHLDKITVSVDEPVTAGKQIALSGSTGKSTGPHLHFELRENGELLNPLKFITNVLAKNADR